MIEYGRFKMRVIPILFAFLFFLNYAEANTSRLKFTNDLLVDKTFYIEEKSGYDTIVKFYLHQNKLRMFYVIFYKGKLDETMTLDAELSSDGSIAYKVFDRPTELRLEKITDKEYVVKEFHNRAKEAKHMLILKFEMPEGFGE